MSPTSATKEASVPWFRDWFGREYLALYPHRDRAEARRAVELLHVITGRRSRKRVLDLACGAGRHLAELRGLGYRAVGLDLSMAMLESARGNGGGSALARGDMRALPFRDGAFDIVTSYFTSFGYFADERDDRHTLGEVRRVLGRGGWFLLDFLNADQVVANLKSRDIRTLSGVNVVQERRLVESGRIVEKRITIGATGGAPQREFLERVRLYRPKELGDMLLESGFVPGPRFGGYDRSEFSSLSPRCIVMAKASL